MEEIAERGIVLEVCPTSNVATQVFSGYEAHPLRALHEAGVKLTLGSDDPPYFGASIGGEYAVARERFGFEEGELEDDHADGSPGRPSRTMRSRAPCSIELLPQATDAANRLAPVAFFDKRSSGRAPTSSSPRVAAPAWRPARSWPPAAVTTARTRAPARAAAQRRAPRPPRRSRSAWSPTSAASTTARSTSWPTRAWSGRSPSSASRRRVLVSKSELGLRAEPLDARAAEVRPRDRRRLPDGRRDGHRRARSSRTRSSRSSTSTRRASRASRPTSRACSSRSRRRATSSATWRACTSRTTAAARPARSAARRSRRSTTTSPATRPA